MTRKHRTTVTRKHDKAVVVSLLNQKGGCGKTTLALSLATAFALDGLRVLLLDCDPQGSSLDWAAARKGDALFPVTGLPRASIHRELPALAQGYDAVVIDGPPRVYDVARASILASDVILLPISPSPFDVWATAEIVDLIREAAAFTESKKVAFVVNRKIVGTALGRDVFDALAEFDLPVLDAGLSQRVAFAESVATGQTVFDTTPTNSPACREVRALANEVRRLFP